MPATISATHTERAHALRLAVCLLGGPAGSRWWQGDFLSASGLEVAAYNFPRSPILASYRAAVTVAKRWHDGRIGRRRILHLFRLPPTVESLLHRTEDSAREMISTRELQQPKRAMALLEEITEMAIDPPEGPVQVGYLDDCWTESGLAELARHYHAAFRNEVEVLPYFAEKA